MEEKDNIFIKIMELIEKETDMPLLGKDIEDWICKSKKNANIYGVYFACSNSKDLEEGG